MENVKIIRSLDELFLYAHEVEQGAEFLPVKLEGSFPLSLHIEGESWDKRIDKRSAQYVIALQTAFDDMLEEFAPEAARDELLVKVETKEGSFISWADIDPILHKLVDKMDNWQAFTSVITGIAAISGYFWWNRYVAYREKVELEKERTKQIEEQEKTRQKEEEEATSQEEARQETLREAFKALQSRADAEPERYASYERPVRTIVKTLEEGDTVAMNDTEDKIPADIAKKCGPRRAPRSEEEITYADGCYVVNSRRYDEGEIVLELEQGNTQIKGYLWQFDENDREAFIASLDNHEKRDSLPFSMDLQINIIHTRRKLKHAVIIGEGAPREGKNCVPLDSILSR